VKGLPDGERPRIGTLAERLAIQHHSAVELIDRLENAGLVERRRSELDRREVLVELTRRGEHILHELSLHHQRELKTSGPALATSLAQLLQHEGGETAEFDGNGRRAKRKR
jgi:DNA-binding MarR family transcriptional regulator